MNIILLSGGSGKRLWPLSNDIRSKQFIKIFRNEDTYQSMLQRVYRQIRAADPEAVVTIATSKSQVSAIHNQIGMDVGISVEPCRRDTFPAIALAVAYLHDIRNTPEDEAVVVCPVDPYVDESYFRCIQELYHAAEKGHSNLVLMGIEPTEPSEKYGYIRPNRRMRKSEDTVIATDSPKEPQYTFTEKPSRDKAWKYIREGALWNGGVFAFRLKYVLDKSSELLGSADYRYLYENYETLKKISFDYAVVEQEKSLEVLTYSGTWKDIGTWNALSGVMEEKLIGKGIIGETCDNVHVVNELDIPVLAVGLKDTVIAASPDGILVTSEGNADKIKPYVDALDQQIMFAEKSWGSYQVIDVEDNSLTIKVTLNPGHKMNYHSHDHRDEVWTVVSGTGRTILDEKEQMVRPGDTISIPQGCKHTIFAGENGIQLIEVQIGKDISLSDKKKYELNTPRQ